MTVPGLLKRAGLPTITGNMQRILTVLREARQADRPFVRLDGVHRRTIHSLIERDWIMEDEGFDGVRYTLTGRGLKALKVYEAPSRYHFDNTCPSCGVRPRGTFASGKRAPYCFECIRAAGRAKFAVHGWQLKAETPCSRCKKRPRHVYPSGKRITYCTHCRKVIRRAERKRKVKRKLWLIGIGRPPICLKCDQPVYHTPNTVYDYCHRHYREGRDAWLRKQKGAA